MNIQLVRKSIKLWLFIISIISFNGCDGQVIHVAEIIKCVEISDPKDQLDLDDKGSKRNKTDLEITKLNKFFQNDVLNNENNEAEKNKDDLDLVDDFKDTKNSPFKKLSPKREEKAKITISFA